MGTLYQQQNRKYQNYHSNKISFLLIPEGLKRDSKLELRLGAYLDSTLEILKLTLIILMSS